jgi:N-acetylglutamate synthase-like GNAT family acetyltransferase
MPNSKLTGISGITGRVVYIRHATDWDRIMIGKRLGTKADRLTQDNAVVAVEEDRVIGFAILEKPGELRGKKDEGCVTIFEDNRRRGVGALVLRHLLEYGPTDAVYTISGRPEYFKRAGFTKARRIPAGSLEKIAGLCGLTVKRGSVARRYERTTAGQRARAA